MDVEGVLAVPPDGFDRAGAGCGEGDVAQAEQTLREREPEKCVLYLGQCALEDVDGEDAADSNDSLVGEDITSAEPLEECKAGAGEDGCGAQLDDVHGQADNVQGGCKGRCHRGDDDGDDARAKAQEGDGPEGRLDGEQDDFVVAEQIAWQQLIDVGIELLVLLLLSHGRIITYTDRQSHSFLL